MKYKHFSDSRIIISTKLADDGSVIARLLLDDLELDAYYFPDIDFWSATLQGTKKGWDHSGSPIVVGSEGMNSFKKFIADNYTVDETLLLGSDDNQTNQLTAELDAIVEELIAAMYGRLKISTGN